MEETEVKRKVLPAVTIAALFVVGLATVFVASASEISPENIVSAINKERESVGLSPLSVNQNLNQAAYTKSSDMLARNYFEHYAYGLTPWMFIIRSGYDYSVAGENLAKGFSTSEDIVKAWMESPTHRRASMRVSIRVSAGGGTPCSCFSSSASKGSTGLAG